MKMTGKYFRRGVGMPEVDQCKEDMEYEYGFVFISGYTQDEIESNYEDWRIRWSDDGSYGASNEGVVIIAVYNINSRYEYSYVDDEIENKEIIKKCKDFYNLVGFSNKQHRHGYVVMFLMELPEAIHEQGID